MTAVPAIAAFVALGARTRPAGADSISPAVIRTEGRATRGASERRVAFADTAGAHSVRAAVARAAARAGNRRFQLSSAPRAHAKPPSKTDLHRKTLRALKRPGGPGQWLRAVRAAEPTALAGGGGLVTNAAAAAVRARALRGPGLHIYEGALSFVTDFCFTYRDSQYK